MDHVFAKNSKSQLLCEPPSVMNDILNARFLKPNCFIVLHSQTSYVLRAFGYLTSEVAFVTLVLILES